MADRVIEPSFPGFQRPWREGDEVVALLGSVELRFALTDYDATMLNSVPAPYQALLVPALAWDDEGMKDILGLLRENGPMHYERLEHEWQQRQKRRGDAT